MIYYKKAPRAAVNFEKNLWAAHERQQVWDGDDVHRESKYILSFFTSWKYTNKQTSGKWVWKDKEFYLWGWNPLQQNPDQVLDKADGGVQEEVWGTMGKEQSWC